MALSVPYLAKLIAVVLDETPFPDPDCAIPLLLGTAATESHLLYTRQHRAGSALGYWQMEPRTAQDHWLWLRAEPRYRAIFTAKTSASGFSRPHLEYDLPYQILMARLHYYVRDNHPLPDADDIVEQAKRWKAYYNTPAGKGTPEKYLADYHRLIAPYWQPGDPP